MEFKDGLMILINLAILGTVIAAAVYIFQIGDKKKSVKCGAVDAFGNCYGVQNFNDSGDNTSVYCNGRLQK